MQPTRTHDAAAGSHNVLISCVIYCFHINVCVCVCGGDGWQEESKQHVKWLRSVKTVR